MDMKKYLLLLAFTLPLLAQQTETDKEITKQQIYMWKAKKIKLENKHLKCFKNKFYFKL